MATLRSRLIGPMPCGDSPRRGRCELRVYPRFALRRQEFPHRVETRALDAARRDRHRATRACARLVERTERPIVPRPFPGTGIECRVVANHARQMVASRFATRVAERTVWPPGWCAWNDAFEAAAIRRPASVSTNSGGMWKLNHGAYSRAEHGPPGLQRVSPRAQFLTCATKGRNGSRVVQEPIESSWALPQSIPRSKSGHEKSDSLENSENRTNLACRHAFCLKLGCLG